MHVFKVASIFQHATLKNWVLAARDKALHLCHHMPAVVIGCTNIYLTYLEYEALENCNYLCHSSIYTENDVIQQHWINSCRMLFEVFILKIVYQN